MTYTTAEPAVFGALIGCWAHGTSRDGTRVLTDDPNTDPAHNERPRAKPLPKPVDEDAPTAFVDTGSAQPSGGAYASSGLEDEQGLVERASGGDEDALCALLSYVGPIVRDRLKPKIGAQWRTSLDEDDVMQVTYLEAFLLIDQFKYRGPDI